MKKMLVLLNRPEDIESHLAGLREIAKTHGIAKVYLARVSRAFGSRARSVVAPHKLDMAARMGDAAASKYLSKIADDLRTEGVDVEPISAGIPAREIDKFIEKNEIDVIVTSNGRSGLSRWPSTGLPERHMLFLCEHVFGLMQPKQQKESHPATTREQKRRPGKAEHNEEGTMRGELR